MSKLLTKVEPDEIKLLKADTLVRLLHRLLLCEARAMDLVSPGILVPYEITVPDGGADGEWRPKSNNAAFTPNQKDIARALVAHARKNVTIDWTFRESAQAQIRVLVRCILRKYGYHPDKQEKAT